MENHSTSHADTPLVEILNALEIPSQRVQRDLNSIPVRARIIWADGEEAIETIAYAHAPGMVLVEVLDRRARLIGYWLPIKDVARLS